MRLPSLFRRRLETLPPLPGPLAKVATLVQRPEPEPEQEPEIEVFEVDLARVDLPPMEDFQTEAEEVEAEEHALSTGEADVLEEDRPPDVTDWLRTARASREAGHPDDARATLESAAQQFPDAASVRHDLARLAEADRDWAEAEKWWREFSALSPAAAWVVPHVAHLIRLQGRLADAETWVGDALPRFPHETAIFIEHARMAEMRRDWPTAEARWAVVADRFPGTWEGPAGQARALRQRGQPIEARALLEDVAARFPSAPGPRHELARIAEGLRDWPVAERWWQEAVTLDPGPWWGHIGLVVALREQGKLTQAEALLTAQIELVPHEAWPFIEYARIAERSADWPAALQRWDEVISRFPDRWEGYSGRARALREQGDAATARDVLTHAVERFPGVAGPIHDLARAAEAQRDWAAAEQSWRRYIPLEPALWWGHAGLANALREQGRFAEAETVLAGQLEPLAAEPAIRIDYARLAEWQRNWADAAARWEDVAARFPHLWDGYRGRSRALRELGKPEDAWMALEDSLERFPTSPQPRHDLAVLAEAAGDWESAAGWWRAAIDLDPGTWWYHQRLANALREFGKPDQAATALTDAMAAFPNEVQLAVAFAQHGDGPDVLDRWQSVCQRFPNSPAGPGGYAQALRQVGEFDKAAGILHAAVERFPANTDLLFRSAFLAEARGLPDQAVAYAQQAISVEPKHHGHYIGLSGIHSRNADLAKAEEVLAAGLTATGDRAEFLLEMARISERKGDWREAAERFRLCYEKYPAELAAATGLAGALYRQGCQSDADAILTDAIERFPHNADLAIAYARLPSFGGLSRQQEFLTRAREVVPKFPDNPQVCRVLADALLVNHLEPEAETFLRDAVQRIGSDRSLLHMLSIALVRQEKWDAAFKVFETITRVHGHDAVVLKDYTAALVSAKRWEQAQEVIRSSIDRFPAEHSFSIALLDILIGQGDLPAATSLWKDLDAKSDNAPVLRRDLFDRRGLLLGLGIDLSEPEQPRGRDVGPSTGTDVDMKDIVTSFESMGGAGLGCEFGLFQRFYGAEPLGLLRWTAMEPEELVSALENEFEGVGTAEQTVLRSPELGNHMEYGASDRRFGMVMHTFVRADQVPPDKMFTQLCRRLTYLRTKFLDDLREGGKIFVYKHTFRNLSDQEIDRIVKAMRRYGDSTFLYVRLQDEAKPFPLVESPEPGLMIGYIDRFSTGPDGKEGSLPATSWAAITTSAYRMWQRNR